MARSPLQSDFVVSRAEPEDDELQASKEASPRATRLVMTIAFVMLGLLVLMCAIGPHIPAGE
jgi:hypothetical protein